MITAGRSGLAIIGGGKIGEALLAGLVRQAGTGDGVWVVERSPQRAAELAARYGIGAVGQGSNHVGVPDRSGVGP